MWDLVHGRFSIHSFWRLALPNLQGNPMNPIRYLILSLVLLSTLFASPTHPPLVPNDESYDDIANLKVAMLELHNE